jgi:electron transport complex protein RnfB
MLRGGDGCLSGNCQSCGLGKLCGTRESGERLWQIDPDLCIHCGRCATACVMAPSAVKCVHSFELCGYCELCGGYYRPDAKTLDTAAEHQLCPTAAIRRRFVEEPYFEYTIDRKLCVGCGKCAKGCGAFGNGSLYLQIQQDLCRHCNECAIARACPANAIAPTGRGKPYLLRA